MTPLSTIGLLGFGEGVLQGAFCQKEETDLLIVKSLLKLVLF